MARVLDLYFLSVAEERLNVGFVVGAVDYQDREHFVVLQFLELPVGPLASLPGEGLVDGLLVAQIEQSFVAFLAVHECKHAPGGEELLLAHLLQL